MSIRIAIVCLAAGGLLSAAGCPAPVAPPPPIAPVPTPVAPPAPTAPTTNTIPGASAPSTSTPAPPPDAAPAEAQEQASPAPAAEGAPPSKGSEPEVETKAVPEPVTPTERMLLLAPQGPVIVEFEFWIDGHPQATAFDQLVNEVLKLADSDGDGTPTWKEVTTSPKFRYGQFGNLPIDRENAPKQIIQQYDLNGDGRFDRAEVPRFLTRNAGGARPFSVRSIAQFQGRNRRGSPTWRALDADDDGQLSAAEWQAAPTQLRQHDQDEDENLVVDELRRTTEVDLSMGTRTRGQRSDFARLLGEHANWDSIRAALEEHYAIGGTLDKEDFLLMGSMFDRLDANGDGKLLRKEFPAINELEPHLRIRVDFGTPREADSTETETSPPAIAKISTLKIVKSNLPEPDAEAGISPLQVIELPERLLLRWAGVTLTFVRNDLIANVNHEMQAEQQLKQYDTNANGYLETDELNEQVQMIVGRLEALDTDGDEKVYPGELAAYLRQRQGPQRVQVHVRAQDQEDLLFQALDDNVDGRFDSLELDQLPARLKRLDVNGDGAVTADELPEGIAVAIGRGGVDNPNQLFAAGPANVPPPTGDLPAWFRAMDTSGDGLISPREFLGSGEKFAALDKNQNGYFEVSEIPAAAANSAPPADSAEPAAPAATETPEQP